MYKIMKKIRFNRKKKKKKTVTKSIDFGDRPTQERWTRKGFFSRKKFSFVTLLKECPIDSGRDTVEVNVAVLVGYVKGALIYDRSA